MFEIDNPVTRKKVMSSLGNVENKIFISVNGNKIFFVTKQYTEKWGLMSKKEVAQKLCEKITTQLNH